jgi:hypothetical protein
MGIVFRGMIAGLSIAQGLAFAQQHPATSLLQFPGELLTKIMLELISKDTPAHQSAADIKSAFKTYKGWHSFARNGIFIKQMVDRFRYIYPQEINSTFAAVVALRHSLTVNWFLEEAKKNEALRRETVQAIQGYLKQIAPNHTFSKAITTLTARCRNSSLIQPAEELDILQEKLRQWPLAVKKT